MLVRRRRGGAGGGRRAESQPGWAPAWRGNQPARRLPLVATALLTAAPASREARKAPSARCWEPAGPLPPGAERRGAAADPSASPRSASDNVLRSCGNIPSRLRPAWSSPGRPTGRQPPDDAARAPSTGSARGPRPAGAGRQPPGGRKRAFAPKQQGARARAPLPRRRCARWRYAVATEEPEKHHRHHHHPRHHIKHPARN